MPSPSVLVPRGGGGVGLICISGLYFLCFYLEVEEHVWARHLNSSLTQRGISSSWLVNFSWTITCNLMQSTLILKQAFFFFLIKIQHSYFLVKQVLNADSRWFCCDSDQFHIKIALKLWEGLSSKWEPGFCEITTFICISCTAFLYIDNLVQSDQLL